MSTTRNIDNFAMVTLRYAGEHHASTEIHQDTVRIYLPNVVITIADADAARSAERVWRDAEQAIPKIFQSTDQAAGYQPPAGSRTWTAVSLYGPLQGRDIQGRLPALSPSGCGELKVRLGSLIIVMDDRYAANRQVGIWNEAFGLARQVFAAK